MIKSTRFASKFHQVMGTATMAMFMAAVAFFGLGSATAQTASPVTSTVAVPTQTTSASPADPDMSGTSMAGQDMVDKAFLRRTVMQGMVSIHVAQMALERTSSDDVKKIANLVIHDRMRLNEAFTGLAKSMGVDLPQDTGKHQADTISKMEKLTGADFDTAYVKFVLDYQKDMDEAFHREANYANNPDLKAIATHAAPVLHKHREAVERLAQSQMVAQK